MFSSWVRKESNVVDPVRAFYGRFPPLAQRVRVTLPELVCVSGRFGGRRGRTGADVRRDAHRQLPVDGAAECRGGEHGENLPKFEHKGGFEVLQEPHSRGLRGTNSLYHEIKHTGSQNIVCIHQGKKNLQPNTSDIMWLTHVTFDLSLQEELEVVEATGLCFCEQQTTVL